MTPARRILETVHLTFAGLWLGVLVMTGSAAAVIFPAMHKLDPRLPGYAGYSGEHWLLAAGHIAAPLFWIADAIQLGCALICGLTLGLIFVSPVPWRRPIGSSIRLLALFSAMGLLAYSLLVLSPRMNSNLAEFWAAAKLGDTPAADAAQALFNADHPTATSILAATFVAVLVLLTSGIFSAVGSPPPARGQERPSRRLETPELAR